MITWRSMPPEGDQSARQTPALLKSSGRACSDESCGKANDTRNASSRYGQKDGEQVVMGDEFYRQMFQVATAAVAEPTDAGGAVLETACPGGPYRCQAGPAGGSH
jgi:hypothetical protein